MYISKKTREIVKNKFGGRCAYSGTILQKDWQIDHIKPIIRIGTKSAIFVDSHIIENMVPTQKIINHYKGSLSLKEFREWYLGGLSERLNTLPKNPKVKKSIRRKQYLFEVASLFGITEDIPFSGKFYFEVIQK